MNLKTIERGEVKKGSPTLGETRIDDVVASYNCWIKSKAEIMNPIFLIRKCRTVVLLNREFHKSALTCDIGVA